MAIFSILISLIFYLITPFLFAYLEIERIVLKETYRVLVLLTIANIMYGMATWPRSALNSLDLKPYAILISFTFGFFTAIPLTLILVLLMKMGLSGIYMSDIITNICNMFSMLVVIYIFAESRFTGVKE